ncbi:FlaF protein [Roseomonas mucosa]|uniref:Flagellar biosynthesis regulatory protein FlaF n=1 Tax=Roseomonas mucosa TaxID=207340 RepID=A0A379N0B5_9PROT|nr:MULTISPECIES: flagellar biosynthesis regulator FlaF [Roseomonas]MBS5902022.1 hypothetical protein [Acetobacteraceae bacterium]MCG7352100.1 flagellar biosynthesis regulator FlaF [Roseomonas mucosa]MCG7355175.1 flagellar biosynthesis regulator FlaF [Roseomonas mucosa]MDT8288687.1 flagellar biosynthesis regulator FlaF [Roseomonas mucosa]MDT8292655.1 flagellar biosynthesis regulator FlaF [Roseomonas mucosa]
MSIARYAAASAMVSPRDTEIAAFRHVNTLLATGMEQGIERIKALHKAHRLWSILLSDLLSEGNALPLPLKARLVSLGLWAQRESISRMHDAASLEPLMSLHRDMIEGLQGQRAVIPTPRAEAFAAESV